MKKLDCKGFSAVEAVLIVAALALVAGAGWFVFGVQSRADQAKSGTGDSSPAASKKSSSSTKETTLTPVADPTEGWTAYYNAEGVYSLRYPTTWVTATHPEWCNPDLVLLAPTAASVGKCATESFGEVSVGSTAGDSRTEQTLDATTYTGIVTTAVTVAGVTGTRQSGTFADSGVDPLGMGPLWPDGTVSVRYTFFTGGRTYVANYNKTPSYPDALADFDLLVTNTLEFHI